MNRRQYLQGAGLAAIGGSLVSSANIAQAQSPATGPTSKTGAPFAFASAPVLLHPTDSSITVLCVVNAPATGWIEYGEYESLGKRADQNSSGFLPYVQRVLKFQLSGLTPGKTYYYRVHAAPITFETAYKIHRGTPINSPVHSFRTLNPGAESASITVWNDTHTNKETLAQLIAAHQAHPSDFLVWNGDVTNDITTEDILINEYLNPAGQAFANQTPCFFSRGNHDVRGQYARDLGHYTTGPDGSYYHIFRHGPVGCLFLDSGEDKPDDMDVYAGINDFAAYRTEQQRWLEKAILEPAFASAPYRVVFLHIPLVWDTEVPESWLKVWNGHPGWFCGDGFEKWHPLLVKAGVQLAVSGHVHRHTWFPSNKAHPYAQITGGGPKPEQATTIRLKADRHQLKITVINLKGETLIEQTIAPAV